MALRCEGTPRQGRQRPDRARRSVAAGNGRRDPPPGYRGGSHCLPPFISQSGPRATGAGHIDEGAARCQHLRVQRRGPRDPRVRAHEHDRRKLLRPAAHAPLHRRHRASVEGYGIRPAPVPDDLVRRHRDLGDSQGISHPHGRIGTCRWRPGGHLLRTKHGARQLGHVRHGRNHSQDRFGQEPPGDQGQRHRSRSRQALQEGQRYPHQGSGRRTDRDRRRWRQHRPCGPLGSPQGWPGKRRGRPRAVLLWTRRQETHGNRRRRHPGLSGPQLLSRRGR